MAVLIVEHDMDFVMSLVDRVVVMEFGEKIAEGLPAESRKPGRARSLPGVSEDTLTSWMLAQAASLKASAALRNPHPPGRRPPGAARQEACEATYSKSRTFRGLRQGRGGERREPPVGEGRSSP
jgi:energy-coupling factor transporter ATP-binding protein EcfA2